MDGKHQPPIAAAIIVIDGRVLLIRRRATEGQLVWQFPAGKIEPGETVDDAAVREAFEEVGLRVQAVADLGGRTHPETRRMVRYVACEVVAGVAFPAAVNEVVSVEWCDGLTLRKRVPHPLHGPVQAYLQGKLVSPRHSWGGRRD